MSYFYRAQKVHELARIAEIILDTFPHRRTGLAVDIEGILEDLGVDLLPRRGFRKHAEGYLARDPRIIVVDERILSYMPRARFTIAEELCHLILEYKLWSGGELPQGARGHELSDRQHEFVERDAQSLAAMLLMPEADFKSVYEEKHREYTATQASATLVVRETLKYLAETFDVSPMAAGYRALKLRLIQRAVYGMLWPKS